jgi:hypothetical protein
MAKKKDGLHYCGGCDRRIQPHQSELSINLIKGGKMYFHETWEGCVESTRESGKYISTELEKELIKITPIY